MKLYYNPNQFVMCSVCGYICSYDTSDFWDQVNDNLTKPKDRIAFCTNERCSQFMKRMRIKPIEVEAEE